MGTGTAIRVGTDVTAVHQVAESVRRFGVRYLERIYTEHEINSCVGEPLVEAASLAANSAAHIPLQQRKRPRPGTRQGSPRTAS